MFWKATISPLCGITTLVERLTELPFGSSAALPPAPL